MTAKAVPSRRGTRPRCRARSGRGPGAPPPGLQAPRYAPSGSPGSASGTAPRGRQPAVPNSPRSPRPSSDDPCARRCASPDRAPRRARSSPAPGRPGSRPPRPPRQSGGSQASQAPNGRPPTTDGLQSNRSGPRGCPSTRVISSPRGAPCWRRRQPAPVCESSARMHPYQNYQKVYDCTLCLAQHLIVEIECGLHGRSGSGHGAWLNYTTGKHPSESARLGSISKPSGGTSEVNLDG